jgi:MraZ protein
VSFRGTFAHALDTKGRLTIPASMREELEAGFVLTRGYGAYLVIYPQHIWDEQERLMAALPRTSEERRAFSRWTWGGAAESVIDRLGRVLIPDHLRSYAGLDDQAVIVGSLDSIEIWSPLAYEQVLSADRERLPDILESLAAKGII